MVLKIKSLENIIQKKYQIIKKIDNPLYYSFSWLFTAGSNYEKLIKNQIFSKRDRNFFLNLNRKIKLIFYIIKSFIKFYSLLLFIDKHQKRHSKIKNIFFSHLNEVKQLNDKKDFYFGLIPDWLNEKYILVLNNNTKKNSYKFFNKLKKNQIITPDFFSIKEEIQILFIYIKLINFFKNLDIKDKNFAKELNFQLYNKEILYCLRKLFFFQKILKTLKAKRVFLTYEGHYSEAFIIKCSKKYKIQTVAFNHSYFYDFQKKYRNLHYLNFRPDIVFLTGQYIKHKIKFSSNQKIVVVGSNRITENKLNIKDFNKKSYNCVMLGDDIELTRNLFKMINDIAKTNSKIKFFIKLHPSVRFEEVVDDQKIFFNQSNIFLTNKKIDELLKEAKWVIYQRTSGVLNSMNYNVRPLYFDNHKNNLDPLSNIKIWKKKFRSKEELQKLLLNDITNSKIRKNVILSKAKKMLKNYFFVMKKKQVKKILK
jgi:hypothetical protein